MLLLLIAFIAGGLLGYALAAGLYSSMVHAAFGLRRDISAVDFLQQAARARQLPTEQRRKLYEEEDDEQIIRRY